MFIVKAEFTSVAGKKYDGILTPSDSYHFGYIQPHLFTSLGLIPIWYGMIPVEKEKVERLYPMIGETANSFFPLRFKSLVDTKGVRLEGTIEGFTCRPKDEIIAVQ